MRRRMAMAGLASMVTLAGLATFPATAATASPTAGQAASKPVVSDIRHYNADKVKAFPVVGATKGLRSQARVAAGRTPPVGTVRPLLALDDFKGKLYAKNYTLKAVGAHIEVWVANDTAFPAGDCRNAVANTTTVTTAQARYLASQFDTVMYPKESAVFSTPPNRDGTNPLITSLDATGDGNKIMTLVDNVRDDNYYDFPAAPTYIAGFFSSAFDAYLDRNVMTIDAFDWLHRTGANPPDAPTDNPCTSRPARPHLYEGVFAHEYQHLLESYQDPNEVSWVNEGLSDFAESLVGYADATRSVFQSDSQSHIYCIQGFGVILTPFNPNPRDCGGAENSLTRWGDQGDAEILADYGNAWSFMLYLRDHFGLQALSALHRDGRHQGLAGVQSVLNRFGGGRDVYRVVHDFQTMMLVDKIVSGGGKVAGIRKDRVTTRSLDSTVNLLNPQSYSSPGAPANGADYVGLRGRQAAFLGGGGLKSVSFSGAKTLPAQPLLWSVVTDPARTAGNPVIFSGTQNNLDSTAVFAATVPASKATLTYDVRYDTELTFDYFYTVISTDGGKTYTPLANADTVTGPLGPALNGTSNGYVSETFNLSAYAGKSVLLGLRYVSDGGVNQAGVFVDNIKVGGTLVSDGSSLAPFKSPTQVRPTPVANWDVRLVGIDTAKHKAIYREFNGRRSFQLGSGGLAAFRGYPVVVAIVGYDDPTEQVNQNAPYTLMANGVTQQGG